MRLNLRYQLVLFSDFSDVRDEEQTRKLFLESLQGYSFQIKPMVEAFIGPSGTRTQSRPSFITKDEAFSVVINSDKTTFEFVNVDINVSNSMSISDFIEKTIDICEKIGILSNRMYRRIGIIRHTFFEVPDVSQICNLFSSHIPFYNRLEMRDWSLFFPAKKILSSGHEVNATSRLSHVNTIIHMNSVNQPFDGISLISDVNTLASNTVDNLSWAEISGIINEIQKVEYEITNQTAAAVERGEL